MERVLVLIDIQKEYTTEGRPFFIMSIQPSLENCRRILQHARGSDWNIYHVRHLQEGKIFSIENEYSGFVEGFEPQKNEKEIIKNIFSCFSSEEFVLEMEKHKQNEIVIIGYGSTMCCLCTILDGYHRGYKMTFVRDASNAKHGPRFGEEETHEHAVDIISTFAKVIKTEDIL